MLVQRQAASRVAPVQQAPAAAGKQSAPRAAQLREMDYAAGAAALSPVQQKAAGPGGPAGPAKVTATEARGLLGLGANQKMEPAAVTRLPEGKSRVVDHEADGSTSFRNFERDGAGQFAITGADDAGPIAYDDVKQGMADCFAMATLAAVARARPASVLDMVREVGVGQYLVRFWVFDGDVRSESWIPVTAAVPTRTVDGEARPAFAHSDDGAAGQMETWPAVIEKAFAAFVERHQAEGAARKGYQAIDYGSPLFAYQSMVGEKPAAGNTRGGTFAGDARDITGREYHWDQQDWSEQIDAAGHVDSGPAAAGWNAMWGAVHGATPVIASDAGGQHVVAVVDLGPTKTAPWEGRVVTVYDQMQGRDFPMRWSEFALKYERVILADKQMPELARQ